MMNLLTDIKNTVQDRLIKPVRRAIHQGGRRALSATLAAALGLTLMGPVSTPSSQAADAFEGGVGNAGTVCKGSGLTLTKSGDTWQFTATFTGGSGTPSNIGFVLAVDMDLDTSMGAISEQIANKQGGFTATNISSGQNLIDTIQGNTGLGLPAKVPGDAILYTRKTLVATDTFQQNKITISGTLDKTFNQALAAVAGKQTRTGEIAADASELPIVAVLWIPGKAMAGAYGTWTEEAKPELKADPTRIEIHYLYDGSDVTKWVVNGVDKLGEANYAYVDLENTSTTANAQFTASDFSGDLKDAGYNPTFSDASDNVLMTDFVGVGKGATEQLKIDLSSITPDSFSGSGQLKLDYAIGAVTGFVTVEIVLINDGGWETTNAFATYTQGQIPSGTKLTATATWKGGEVAIAPTEGWSLDIDNDAYVSQANGYKFIVKKGGTDITENAPTTLNNGDTLEIEIEIDDSTPEGHYPALLRIVAWNNYDEQEAVGSGSIAFDLTVLPPSGPQINPTPTGYTWTAVGGAEQSFTLTEVNGVAANITGVAWASGASSKFDVTGSPASPVAANGSTTVKITPKATAANGDTDKLKITYTATDGSGEKTCEITVKVQVAGYQVKFDKNTTDTVTSMPSNFQATLSGGNASVTAAQAFVGGSTLPVRSGYEFLGWNTNKNAATGLKPANFPQTIRGNTTYYAIWAKVETGRITTKLDGAATQITGVNAGAIKVYPTGTTSNSLTVTAESTSSFRYQGATPGDQYDIYVSYGGSEKKVTTITAGANGDINYYTVKPASPLGTGVQSITVNGGASAVVLQGQTVTLVATAKTGFSDTAGVKAWTTAAPTTGNKAGTPFTISGTNTTVTPAVTGTTLVNAEFAKPKLVSGTATTSPNPPTAGNGGTAKVTSVTLDNSATAITIANDAALANAGVKVVQWVLGGDNAPTAGAEPPAFSTTNSITATIPSYAVKGQSVWVQLQGDGTKVDGDSKIWVKAGTIGELTAAVDVKIKVDSANPVATQAGITTQGGGTYVGSAKANVSTGTAPDSGYVFVGWSAGNAPGTPTKSNTNSYNLSGVSAAATFGAATYNMPGTPAAITIFAHYKAKAILAGSPIDGAGEQGSTPTTYPGVKLDSTGKAGAEVTKITVSDPKFTVKSDSAVKPNTTIAAGGSSNITLLPDTSLTPGTYVFTVTTEYDTIDNDGNAAKETVTTVVKHVVSEKTYELTVTADTGLTTTVYINGTQATPKSGTTNKYEVTTSQSISVVSASATAGSTIEPNGWNGKSGLGTVAAETSNNIVFQVTGNAAVNAVAKSNPKLELDPANKASSGVAGSITTSLDLYTGMLKNTGAGQATGLTYGLYTDAAGTTADSRFTLTKTAGAAATLNGGSNTGAGSLKVTPASGQTWTAGTTYTTYLVVKSTNGGTVAAPISLTVTAAAVTTFDGSVTVYKDKNGTTPKAWENVSVELMEAGTSTVVSGSVKNTNASGVVSYTGLDINKTYDIYVKANGNVYTKVQGIQLSNGSKNPKVQYYTVTGTADRTVDTAATIAGAWGGYTASAAASVSLIAQENTTLTFTAAASASDYAVKEWKKGATVSQTGGTVHAPTITGTDTYTVYFEKKTQITLSFDGNVTSTGANPGAVDPKALVDSGVQAGVPGSISKDPSAAANTGVDSLGVATLPGYVFQGWYTKADNTGTKVTATSAAPYKFSANTTLYAHWARAAITWSDQAAMDEGEYSKSYNDSIVKTAATSTDGGTIKYVVTTTGGVPGGLSMDTSGTVTGIPYLVGDSAITFTAAAELVNDSYHATTGVGLRTANKTITIKVNPTAPSLSLSATNVVEGKPISGATYIVTVKGPRWNGTGWETVTDTFTYTAGTKGAETAPAFSPTVTMANIGSVAFTGANAAGTAVTDFVTGAATKITAAFTPANDKNIKEGSSTTTHNYKQNQIWTAASDVFDVSAAKTDKDALKVDPASHSFVFADGTAAHKEYGVASTGTNGLVTNAGSGAVDQVAPKTFTLTNSGNRNTGALTWYWKSKGSAAADKQTSAVFEASGVPTSAMAPGAPGATITIKVKAGQDVGNYSDVLVIEDATHGTKAEISVFFPVQDPLTFKADVTTLLQTVAQYRTSTAPAAGQFSGTVKVAPIKADGSLDTEVDNTGYDATNKKFNFTLNSGTVYAVLVGGYRIPGMTISSADPHKSVKVFEVTAANDPSTLATLPTLKDGATAKSWFVENEPITVTPSATLTSGSDTYKCISLKDTTVVATPTEVTTGGAYTATVTRPADYTATYKKAVSLIYDVQGGTKPASGDLPNSGVSATPLTFAVVEGETVKLSGCTYTKNGFVFDGWDTNAAGDGTRYQAGQDFTIPTGGDTLYAIWKAAGGGLALSDLTITLRYGEAIPASTAMRLTGLTSGASASYAATATGANTVTAAHWNTVPTVNATTGAVTGKPILSQINVSGSGNTANQFYAPGPYTYKVTVTDSATSKTAEATLTINVVKDPTALNSGTTAVVDPDKVFFIGTDFDPNNDLASSVKVNAMGSDGTTKLQQDVPGTWQVLGSTKITGKNQQFSLMFTPDDEGFEPLYTTVTLPNWAPGEGTDVDGGVTGKYITKADLTGLTAAPNPGSTAAVKNDFSITANTVKGNVNYSGTPLVYNSSKNTALPDGYVAVDQVTWTTGVADGKYKSNSDYTALITLVPSATAKANGFCFDPDSEDWTSAGMSGITGATVTLVSHTENAVVLSVTFPKQPIPIKLVNADPSVPVVGTSSASVDTSPTELRYTVGNPVWKAGGTTTVDASHPFAAGTAYTLTVTFTAGADYIFDSSVFGTAGAVNYKHSAKSGAVVDVDDLTTLTADGQGKPLYDAAGKKQGDTGFNASQPGASVAANALSADGKTLTVTYQYFIPQTKTVSWIEWTAGELTTTAYYALTATDVNSSDVKRPAQSVYGHKANTATFSDAGKNNIRYTIHYTDGTKDENQTFGSANSLAVPGSGSSYVTLANGKVFTNNTSAGVAVTGQTDQATFDGKGVYLAYTAGGKTYYATNHALGTLTVQELEAKSIALTDNWSADDLTFKVGDKFKLPTTDIKANVNFNGGDLASLNEPTDSSKSWAHGAKTNGSDKFFYATWADADSDGVFDAGEETVMVPGTTGLTAAHNGKMLYACYIDVNGHLVATPVGPLKTGEKQDTDVKVWIKNESDPTDKDADVSGATGGTSPDKKGSTEPEYGETVSAQVTGGLGSITYQWTVDGTPVSGATGPSFTIPADAIGKQIDVIVTDAGADGSTKTAQSVNTPTAQKRTITFDVAVKDKMWDGSSQRLALYTTADFPVSNVINSDAVTVLINDTDNALATGIKYMTSGAASADVGSELTLPAPIFATTGDTDAMTNYTLGGAQAGYYRVSKAMTDAFEHKGKILSSVVSPIVVVNDDLDGIKAGADVPVAGTYTDFDVPTGEDRYDVDGTYGSNTGMVWEWKDGSGNWVAITTGTSGNHPDGKLKPDAEYRVTTKVDTTGDNKFDPNAPAYFEIDGVRYPATEKTVTDTSATVKYVIETEAEKVEGVVHVDVYFDSVPVAGEAIPTKPTRVTDLRETEAAGGGQIFTANWFYKDGSNWVAVDNTNHTDGKFKAGKEYRVEVSVQPTSLHAYNDPDTHFFYHFGDQLSVQIVKKGTTTTTGDGKYAGLTVPASGKVWKMEYPFEKTQNRISQVSDPGPGGGALKMDPTAYYAKTDGKHDATTRTSGVVGDNTTYKFAIDRGFANNAVATYADGSTRTLLLTGTSSAANLIYGADWRLVYGTDPASAKDHFLDNGAANSYSPYVFTETVASGVITAKDSVSCNGKNVYIQVGDTVLSDALGTLEVKQLEADAITAQGALTKLRYKDGDKFSSAGITGADVDFNNGDSMANTVEMRVSPTNGQAAALYKFGYFTGTPGAATFVELTSGTSALDKTTFNGKLVYIAYTDVNGHFVYAPLGSFSFDDNGSTAAIVVVNTTHGNTDTQYGDVLEAQVSGTDSTGADLAYQWQRLGSDGKWADITGATDKTYRASKADVGSFVRVKLTKDGSKVLPTAVAASDASTTAGVVSDTAVTTDKTTKSAGHIYVDKKKLTVEWTWTLGAKVWDATDVAAVGTNGANFVYDTTRFAGQLTHGQGETHNDSFALTPVTGATLASANVGDNQDITITGGGTIPTADTAGSVDGTTVTSAYDWTRWYTLETIAPKGSIYALQLTWNDFVFYGRVKQYDGTTDVYKADNFSLTTANSGDKLTGQVAPGTESDSVWGVKLSASGAVTNVTTAAMKTAIEDNVRAINVAYASQNSLEARDKHIDNTTAGRLKANGHSTIELSLTAINGYTNVKLPAGKFSIHSSAINPKQVTVGPNTADDVDGVLNPGKVTSSAGGTGKTLPGKVSSGQKITGDSDVTFSVQGVVGHIEPTDTNAKVTVIGVTNGKSDGITWTDNNYKLVWKDGPEVMPPIEGGKPTAIKDVTIDPVVYGDGTASLKVTATVVYDGKESEATSAEYTFATLESLGIKAIIQHDTNSDGNPAEYDFAHLAATKAGWDNGTSNTTASINVKFVLDTVTDANATEFGKTGLGTGTITVNPRTLHVTPAWSLTTGKYYDGTNNALSPAGTNTLWNAATASIPAAADACGAMNYTYAAADWAFTDADKVEINTAGTGYNATLASANKGENQAITITLPDKKLVKAASASADLSNRYSPELASVTGNIVARPVTVWFPRQSVEKGSPVDVNLLATFVSTDAKASKPTDGSKWTSQPGIIAGDEVRVATKGTYTTDSATPHVYDGTSIVGQFTNNVTASQDLMVCSNANYAVTVGTPIDGDVTKKLITAVSVIHKVPVASGVGAGTSLTAGEEMTYSNKDEVADPTTKWYDITGVAAANKWSDTSTELALGTGTFTAGHTYRVESTFTPKDGYEFATNAGGTITTKFAINGDAAGEFQFTHSQLKKNADGTVTVMTTFEVKAEDSKDVVHVNAFFTETPVSGGTAKDPNKVDSPIETKPGSGANFTAKWYEHADQTAANAFDITTPGSAFTGPFNPGKYYTVAVDVKPNTDGGYAYTGATTYMFHFGTDNTYEVSLDTETAKNGVWKHTVSGEEIYTMYLTLGPTDNGVASIATGTKDSYYLTTTDHGVGLTYDVNTTADNNATPGGKKDVGFTFTAADTTVTYANGTTKTYAAADYGTKWGFFYDVSGTKTLLTNNTSFNSTNDLNGKELYLGAMKDNGSGTAVLDEIVKNEAVLTLNIHKLEVMSIEATPADTVKTVYKVGEKLTVPAMTSVVTKFNDTAATGSDYLDVTYSTATTPALAENKTVTDVNAHQEYYYKLDNTRVDVSGGDDGYAVQKNDIGKTLYICYTDVNGKEVKTPLGALAINGKQQLPDVVVEATVEPKNDVGKAPDGPKVVAPKPYSLNSATGTANNRWEKWDSANNKWVDNSGAAFAKGEKYRVVATVKLDKKDEYDITTDTRFMLAGRPCTTDDTASLAGGTYKQLTPSAAAENGVYGDNVTYTLIQEFEIPADPPADATVVEQVNVFFNKVPTADEEIHLTPDGVTDTRSTVTGETSGTAFVAHWYENASNDNGWDPANPTANSWIEQQASGGTAPTFKPGKFYTVAVKVKANEAGNYAYGEGTNFYFHFGENDLAKTIQVVKSGGTAGTAKVNGLVQNDKVYTMFYTFYVPASKIDKITAVDGTFVNPNYSATGTHSAADGTTPNGEVATPNFVLDYTINSITVHYKGESASTTHTIASTTTDPAEQAILAQVKAYIYPFGDTTKPGVVLDDNYPFTQTTNDGSTKSMTGRFDDQKVYVSIGDVVSTGSVVLKDANDATKDTLVVKELQADDIEPVYKTDETAIKLNYNQGDAFDPSNITDANVDFLTGVTGLAKADVTIADEMTSNTGTDQTKYYYELDNGTRLKTGDTMNHATMDGRDVYICYTDVNGHEVREPLGTLRVKAPEDPTIVKVAANVKQPIAGQTIANAGADVLLAISADNRDVTDKVETGTVTWTNISTSGAALGTTFQAGGSYKAEFDVKIKSGNTTNKFVAVADPADYLDLLINGVTHNNAGTKTWLEGPTDTETVGADDSINQIKVDIKPTSTGSEETSYRVTVTFNKISDKANVLAVLGTAKIPEAGAAVAAADIKPLANQPYELVTDSNKWYEQDGTTEITDPAAQFKPGKSYYAELTVKLKDAQKPYYQFTQDTTGSINSKPEAVAGAEATVDNTKVTRTPDTAGIEPETITMKLKFDIPTIPVNVIVRSDLPAIGGTAADMNATIKNKYDPESDGHYTVDLTKAYWADQSGAKLDAAHVFAPGRYQLVFEEVTPDAGYTLPTAVNGYTWQDGSKNAIDIDPAGDGKYKVVFNHTILEPGVKVPDEIAVVVTPPVAGETPDKVGKPGNDNTEIVGEVKWTDPSGAEVTGKFDYEKEYTATVIAKPVDPDNFDPTDPKYKFNGQSPTKAEPNKDAEGNPDGTYTLIYTFPKTAKKETITKPGGSSGGGGGGGGTVELPQVFYKLGEVGVTNDLTAEKVKVNGKPSKVPKVEGLQIEEKDGTKKTYTFIGWSETDPAKTTGTPVLVDPTTFKITKDKTFYAVYEIQGHTAVDHSHYVIGFPNGTFGPGADITRGEVATIIARACLDGFIEGANYGNPGGYSDVERHWAYSAISYCTMSSVFTGYTDGTFRPNQPITRQELATVVARLAGLIENQGMPFTDASQVSKWALDGVYTAYANGWINGYKDGSFKPLQNITRAETVKIFNAYLKRGVDKEGLSDMREYVHDGVASNNKENGYDQYMTWPDVPTKHWAYYEIIEAANDHTFYWLEDDNPTPPEHWTSVWIDEVWRYHDNNQDGARPVNPDTTTPQY